MIRSLIDGKNNKEISKLVPYYLKDESRIPKFVLNQKKEIEAIKDSVFELEKEFNLKIVVEKDSEKAMPGKPQLVLE